MRFRGRVGNDGWLLPLTCIFLSFDFFQWDFLYQWIICGTLKVIYREFPSSPVVRTSSFHCKGHVWSLVGKLRQWHPTPVLLPGKSMDGGAWWAAVHGVAESWTRLSDFIFTFMHWRRAWQPTPVFLPGESQGWGSLVGCHLWGCTDSDTTEVTAAGKLRSHKSHDPKAMWHSQIKKNF